MDDKKNKKEGTQSDTLLAYLGQFVTAHKRAVIARVLNQRTEHITMVLEDIYQSQNASAVLRTCECYGLQRVHIIENENTYSLNRRVLKGAEKWIDIVQYNRAGEHNTAACFEQLKSQGYQVLATVPAEQAQPITAVDVNQKVALVMGNELHGLSDYALQQAHAQVKIPMYGFTESLNLSVSAAICIHELIGKLKASSIAWGLSEARKRDIELRWFKKLIRNSDVLEKHFLESIT